MTFVASNPALFGCLSLPSVSGPAASHQHSGAESGAAGAVARR